MSEQELLNLFTKALGYTPIVYKQSTYNTDQNEGGRNFVLEFKHTDIPDDSLLFFIPAFSSLDPTVENVCKLIIRMPRVKGRQYEYVDLPLSIIVEQNDNVPRPAKKGDIIANRMCIFRFRLSSKEAVLCNSPLYDNAIYSSFQATDARFLNRPVIVDNEDPTKTYTLVSTKEFNELVDEVTKLKNRIQYGSKSPEEALADCPAGTIYIQYEED